jgi:hypothetical protein
MKKAASIVGVLLLSACASATPPPSDPTILVLPGTGKSFDLFRSDDQACRAFALSEVSGKAEVSNDSYAAAALMQQRYDRAFAQCMYARGHKVPVSGPYSDSSRPGQSAGRTPPPPPPPGQPPPEAPPDYRPK